MNEGWSRELRWLWDPTSHRLRECHSKQLVAKQAHIEGVSNAWRFSAFVEFDNFAKCMVCASTKSSQHLCAKLGLQCGVKLNWSMPNNIIFMMGPKQLCKDYLQTDLWICDLFSSGECDWASSSDKTLYFALLEKAGLSQHYLDKHAKAALRLTVLHLLAPFRPVFRYR